MFIYKHISCMENLAISTHDKIDYPGIVLPGLTMLN